MSKETTMSHNDKIHPKDRNNLVFIIFCWLGIGMLLPWNFFYNVDGYWKCKFRNIQNETITSDKQKFWASDLSIVSMAPNFSFLLINAIIGHKLSISPRIYISIISNIILFIISLVFTKINTDSWQSIFYYLSLASALLFNVNDSVFQGAFASLVGRFPEKYMSSFAQGQAIGGTIASLVSVSMLAVGGSDSNAALFSFTFAAIFLLSALILFYYVSKQEFFMFYSSTVTKKVQNEAVPKVNFKDIIRKTWIFNLSVFLNFFVTLGVFPSYHSLAETTSSNQTWQKYFVPVACFLVFNVCDLLGRMVAHWVKWPKPSFSGSIITLVLSLARFSFIPLLLFCNISPEDRNITKVYFKSDTAFLIINILFSLTNGYIANICMMSAPKMVHDPNQQGVAASYLVFSLVGGLLGGSAISRLWVKLL